MNQESNSYVSKLNKKNLKLNLCLNISVLFEKTQDLEIALKRDIDEFDFMNGQNNSAIELHNEELFVVSESEADPINI